MLYGDCMNDFDKVVLVYRYFFYNEVFYDDRVDKVLQTCRKRNATVDDYNRLIRVLIERETFNRIMTDILTLFNPNHY